MDYKDYTSYEPMPHAVLKNHWRVLMQNMKGSYTVYVDKDYIRTFTDTTLPTFIKMKLSFMSVEEPLYTTEMMPLYPNIFIYNGKITDLANVGWRVTEHMNVLVVHDNDLDSIRGKPITENKNDTRSKSKKQSKENTRQSRLLSFFTTKWRLW
jgi:hypothetical protein